MKSTLLFGVRAVMVFALGMLCGCSSQPTNPNALDVGGVDGGAIVSLINDLPEANPTALRQAFAEGSVPNAETLKRLGTYGFRVAGTPKVSADTATVQVKFNLRKDGQEVGDKEWTMTKVGDRWKVKAAPLP